MKFSLFYVQRNVDFQRFLKLFKMERKYEHFIVIKYRVTRTIFFGEGGKKTGNPFKLVYFLALPYSLVNTFHNYV